MIHINRTRGNAGIRRLRHAALVLLCALAGALLPSGARAQQPFAQVNMPTGVATDVAGNVFVVWDAVLMARLSKFDPNGVLVGEVPLGGPTVGVFTGSHLALDPGSGNILMLTPLGVLYTIRPDTLEIQPMLDLNPLLLPTQDAVYDVLQRAFQPMVLGVAPRYMDIAVRRIDPNRLDLFITGNTGAAGGFPFVVRVRFDAQAQPAIVARAIVTSTGTTLGAETSRPGIAVNNQGVVITTLPFPTNLGFINGLVAFGADFPENPQAAPRFVLLQPDGSPLDFTSTGMTTDPVGNFYVSTGVIGLSACGVGASGSLVFLPATLDSFLCIPSGRVLARTEDVAVSPAGDRVYLLESGNLVLIFQPAVLPPVIAAPITNVDWEHRPRRGMPVWP